MAKLVAIGDSLTQGVKSMAISDVGLSYPAMIADCLGIPVHDFRFPNFMGKGGLPLNLEWLARELEDAFGPRIGFFEWIPAVFKVHGLIDQVEEYWERGGGSLKSKDVLYHNLAVLAYQVGDSFNIDAGMCQAAVSESHDDFFEWPSEPKLRTAYRVLNPAQMPERHADTQLSIAKRIKQEDGEIENLIVWLGANNCLGTVVHLRISETGDEPPGPNSPFTLWKPNAFRKEYEELEQHVQEIAATNVYVATIPHVTIPPVTRGIMNNRGRLPKSRKYFDYYTRFSIKDKDFNPNRDPKLTRAEAELIDDYIDQYNITIREVADRNGWHLVDQCKVLDNLAVRRNHGAVQYSLPNALKDLSVRFFELGPNGDVMNGGLISLDGVHPTTCGYAIVAQEFINVMRHQNPEILDIDFSRVRTWDTLVTSPPHTLTDMFNFLAMMEKNFRISRALHKG